MRFALSEDQQMLREAVADVLGDACTPDRVRASWNAPDLELWSLLAEQGVFALELDADTGGMGMGMVEVAAILTEAGKVGFPGPLIETLSALPLVDNPSLVEAIVGGEARIACAPPDAPVPHAGTAAQIWRVSIHGVARHTDPALTPFEGVDGARHLATVTGPISPMSIDGPRLFDRLALGSAAVLLGLSQTLLDLAVDYAKQRRQFGKPIGSFQAVQHHLANALLALKFAEPAVQRAAWAIAHNRPEAPVDVSSAKALASDAADKVARLALQCHGAIGYTWEFDLHLFHKRSMALQRAWGDAAWHRNRVADHLQLPA
jgi:hypothetical protein